MKSDKLMLYIIEIFILIFVFGFIFFSQIFTKIIMAIVLFILMIITNKFVKSYKLKGRYNRNLTIFMVIVGSVYIAMIYVLGIYIGFVKSTVKLSLWSMIHYIIPYIVIIISTENIRKTILLKDEKKSNIIVLIITVILDIALTTNIYNVKTLKDYYMLIGFIMFSSIANNILYNYIIREFRNSKAIILYRLITVLYVYIIPIIPDIHILFESILRMIVPYIIYVLLVMMYGKKEIEISNEKKVRDIVISVISVFISICVVMLISCKFKYGMLVVGSGSMTDTINKGDAIIYECLDEPIEVGDIIVFDDNGVKIIHRVISKKDSGNGVKYITKGDANIAPDKNYRVEADIIGKVKLRIPHIGHMALKLNELFVKTQTE